MSASIHSTALHILLKEMVPHHSTSYPAVWVLHLPTISGGSPAPMDHLGLMNLSIPRRRSRARSDRTVFTRSTVVILKSLQLVATSLPSTTDSHTHQRRSSSLLRNKSTMHIHHRSNHNRRHPRRCNNQSDSEPRAASIHLQACIQHNNKTVNIRQQDNQIIQRMYRHSLVHLLQAFRLNLDYHLLVGRRRIKPTKHISNYRSLRSSLHRKRLDLGILEMIPATFIGERGSVAKVCQCSFLKIARVDEESNNVSLQYAMASARSK